MQTAAAQPDTAPATLEEALAEAAEALAAADGETADLRLRPGWFKRNVFGRRSEKRISGLPLPQTSLFEAAGIDPGDGPAEEAPAAAEAPPPARSEEPAQCGERGRNPLQRRHAGAHRGDAPGGG